MTIRVTLRPLAEADLNALFDYVTREAGPRTADGYLTRIEAAVNGLGEFLERGTIQEALGPGFRTIGFERRVTIVFRVLPDEVQVFRVLYGGRDLEHALSGE